MATTMITSGQKEEGVNVIAAAARKAGAEAIEELTGNGVLNVGNYQRGVLAQGDKIAAAVKATVKTVLAELADNVVGRLKRLFTDCTIELDATDGKETIAGAKDVFTGGIYGAACRGPGKPTSKTPAIVYEMIKGGTYMQIFGGFGENLKRLCWQESQIVGFCRNHRDLLRKEGYGTFFLFEGEVDTFFVAFVHVRDDGRLEVFVDEFGRGIVWDARCRRRVVSPQL